MSALLTRLVRSDGVVVADAVRTASNPWTKFVGLMGRRSLAPGEGLWFPGSTSIHMMFMRFRIDVLFLGKPDAEGWQSVVSLRENLPTWRGVVWWARGASGTLELDAGTLTHAGVRKGDKVRFDPVWARLGSTARAWLRQNSSQVWPDPISEPSADSKPGGLDKDAPSSNDEILPANGFHWPKFNPRRVPVSIWLGLFLIAGLIAIGALASLGPSAPPSLPPVPTASPTTSPVITPVPTPTPAPSLAPFYIAPAPTAGPDTSIRLNQVTVSSNPGTATSPAKLSLFLTVVPGQDMEENTLSFSLTVNGVNINGAARSTAPSPDPSGQTAAWSYWVDFNVPHASSSGTLSITLVPAGKALTKQSVAWPALP